MKTTLVQFVIDRSGSMSNIWSDVETLYKNLFEGIKERSRREGLTTLAGLTTFAYTPNVRLAQPVDSTNPQSLGYPNGQTALYDGVLASIEGLQQVAASGAINNDPDTAYLVIVLTDGVDNHSVAGSQDRLGRLIKNLQGDGRWTFAFNVPPDGFAKSLVVNRLNVPEDNVREWEATRAGVRETEQKTSVGTQSYFNARAQGQTQVTNIYKVETDLSNGVDLAKLTDFSSSFKELKVDKEQEIRPFVESHTAKKYVIGSAFYQLTKKEKIQPSKSVLIRKKGEKKVYGGLEAKRLLGLHTGPTDVNVVTPGNHGAYDIFVQSRTVNRKVVRGTSVLVDVNKKKGDQPTWDHTLGGTR